MVRQEVRIKRVTKAEGRAFERDVAKAHAHDNTRVFTRRAAEIDGEPRPRLQDGLPPGPACRRSQQCRVGKYGPALIACSDVSIGNARRVRSGSLSAG